MALKTRGRESSQSTLPQRRSMSNACATRVMLLIARRAIGIGTKLRCTRRCALSTVMRDRPCGVGDFGDPCLASRAVPQHRGCAMTRRKQGSSRQRSAKLAADIAGSHGHPARCAASDDAAIRTSAAASGSKLRKSACRSSIRGLPCFVHPRSSRSRSRSTSPTRTTSRSSFEPWRFRCASAQQGREIPSHIWHLMKLIPRALNDLKHAVRSGVRCRAR